MGSCLILEFVLDFRKDNLLILVIKSLSLSKTNSPGFLERQSHDFGKKISFLITDQLSLVEGSSFLPTFHME